ncbi:MAG: acyltransferase [Burkholderiales bacterium]|nr:acyltransferase [Burkholderiales bacterium]
MQGSPDIRSVPYASTRHLAFLDNLKAWLTLLVVMHHAGQPYGPTGGAWPVSHAEKFALLGPFFHVNASFFMGLFFLISAYFVPDSYERKGARRFLAERLLRLGLPVLAFGLVVFPLLKHFRRGDAWGDCFLPFEWAHLWFLGHLLVYSLIYVGYRRLSTGRARPANDRTLPGHTAIALYPLGLAAASTLVRSAYPIDTWVRFVVPAELAHLPQYASLFLIGVIAGRRRWLEGIPPRIGRIWLGIGLFAIAARYAVLSYVLSDEGWTNAFGWNLWEAMLCTGLCIGLPYVFQRHVASTGPLARFGARHAFAVYIIHLPILALIQLQLEATTLGPLVLTALSGGATVLVCYTLAVTWSALALRVSTVSRASRPLVGTET